MSSRSFVTGLCWPTSSFLSSLTRSAYLKVFNVFSQHYAAGETFAIMVVLLFPVKESFSTWVSLLPRNGVWFFSWSKALMHSLRAKRDLLISAPSILVYLFWSTVSAPRSLPARSMKDIIEYLFESFVFFSCICRIACERELSALAPVTPLVLT